MILQEPFKSADFYTFFNGVVFSFYEDREVKDKTRVFFKYKKGWFKTHIYVWNYTKYKWINASHMLYVQSAYRNMLINVRSYERASLQLRCAESITMNERQIKEEMISELDFNEASNARNRTIDRCEETKKLLAKNKTTSFLDMFIKKNRID